MVCVPADKPVKVNEAPPIGLSTMFPPPVVRPFIFAVLGVPPLSMINREAISAAAPNPHNAQPRILATRIAAVPAADTVKF